MRCASRRRSTATPCVRPARYGGSSRARTPCAAGLEVGGRSGTHRAAQHRQGAVDLVGPGGGRTPGGRWRGDVPVPLAAGVRPSGPLAVAARDGLGGRERWEHGDDSPDRGAFVEWTSPPGTTVLRIVEFSIFPHLNHEGWSENTMAAAERWAADIAVRHTPSTTRRRSGWPTVPSRWSPKGGGSCSPHSRAGSHASTS